MEYKCAILVVDDDRDMCRIISSFLKDEGHRVDKAYDGEQAIKKIKRRGYNLMLLDYKLPDMDGINVLKAVRRIEPSIKVIMISAYGSTSIKSIAKKLRVYRFLDKPFDVNRLIKIVKDALAKKPGTRLTAPLRDCPRFTGEAVESGLSPVLKAEFINERRCLKWQLKKQ